MKDSMKHRFENAAQGAVYGAAAGFGLGVLMGIGEAALDIVLTLMLGDPGKPKIPFLSLTASFGAIGAAIGFCIPYDFTSASPSSDQPSPEPKPPEPAR